MAPAEERGAMRQRIVALLQDHPEGLAPPRRGACWASRSRSPIR